MIETSVALIGIIDKDILRIAYKENCYVDLPEFAENLRAYKTLMTTPSVYVLTVAGEGATISAEVRTEFAKPGRSGFKRAEAFVIKTMAQRILANFVMKVQKPTHLVKFFTEEEEAMDWLTELKKQAEPIPQ